MLRRAMVFAATRFAVVNVQGAAAELLLGKYHFAAVAPQHADRGGVHVAEEKRHDAAIEHGDAGAARADGGQNIRGRLKKCCRNRRQHGIHVA